ncbi:hypothetical protein N7519_002401 [Penicillium mononematosum]|uniref:uncharacterized protein n=1 Tax=Penicillium mononematosum TaxID=268346 RepID=UPI002546AB12|nr:uncharacterized protein N7519_002401 [Penicillium mononematosum]KAJ6187493.1 hypothetical protein N7519_002401 [Penicillium mononematosum]
MCHSIGLQLTTTQLIQTHILERVLTGATSGHQTPNAGDSHANEMDVTAILGLEVQNTKTARDLEEQKQDTNRLLLKEPKWTESAVNPQCMVNDIGLSSASTLSQHDLADKLKESREQNAQLRRKMKEQEDIILNLEQSHKETVRRCAQRLANIPHKRQKQAKRIADLESRKERLVSDLAKQTKKTVDLQCLRGMRVRDLKRHEEMIADLQCQKATLVGDLEKQKKIVADLYWQKEMLFRDLGEQGKMIANFRWQKGMLVRDLEKQAKTIANLHYQQGMLVRHLGIQGETLANLQYQKGKLARDLGEQKKKTADVESQKARLVRDLEKQTSIASALETRDMKVEKVIYHIASIMYSELEYQEQLISKTKPDGVESLELIRNTLKDLVETTISNDEHSDTMLNHEDEPQFEQVYTDILSRFRDILARQARKLDVQKGIIDEQTRTIFELEAQKRKVASELEEQTGKLALTLEFFGEDSGEYACL